MGGLWIPLIMKRIIIKKGDIFSVQLGENQKKYFQFVTRDLSQLSSDVIRAFRESYQVDECPSVDKVITGDTDFYAHCLINVGVKMNLWEKFGNSPDDGLMDDVIFRSSTDYGRHQIAVSKNWWVWKPNEERRFIGAMQDEFRHACLGLVVTPDDIVYRMRNGDYGIKKYPM